MPRQGIGLTYVNIVNIAKIAETIPYPYNKIVYYYTLYGVYHVDLHKQVGLCETSLFGLALPTRGL